MMYESLVSEETQLYQLPGEFRLESGQVLEDVEVAYRTWGTPSKEAVLVCHALTGSADADDWWAGILGPGRALDPERDYIISSNVLGGCYGTTGPTSIVSGQGVHFAADFPSVTIRDMVHLQARLLEGLGVERLRLIVGGSMGGMQVLEWAVLYPERVAAIAPVCSPARHSGWCIAISEAQRQAIRADSRWRGGYYRLAAGPSDGLAAARMMALASYRSWDSFEERFSRERHVASDVDPTPQPTFAMESYLRYQGNKLVGRFDANTYVRLTEAMDSHDVGFGRGDWREVLRAIDIPTLVVGVSSDVLYPLVEQRQLAEHMPSARLEVIDSPHGHDAFLIEFEQLDSMLKSFLGDEPSLHRRVG